MFIPDNRRRYNCVEETSIAERDLADPREALVDGSANQLEHPDKNKDESLALNYQAAAAAPKMKEPAGVLS